jgi:H+/Cl- antiporter ClcA
MKEKRTIKLLLIIAGVLATTLVLRSAAFAQCAMCKNAVTGSPNAAKLSESLNFAIIILLIPPVLIFCGLFALAYRYRKARGGGKDSSPDDDRGQGTGVEKTGTRKQQSRKREAGGALA